MEGGVAAAAALLNHCGGGAETPTSPPSSPVSSASPSFVVIIVDDMAADLFGPARTVPFLSLPNLERLAGRGVLFDHAFVTTSLCSPSRASMLSGLYAHSHRVLNNQSGDL